MTLRTEATPLCPSLSPSGRYRCMLRDALDAHREDTHLGLDDELNEKRWRVDVEDYRRWGIANPRRVAHPPGW